MAVNIKSVEPGSPAHRAGICAGAKLVSINGNEINDVLDYRFYMTDTDLELILADDSWHTSKVHIKKDEYEELGLEFSTYLIDKQHTCTNKCIFCFVDQMPKGMRETLYVKDDDSRMSFLFGNYVTMTNLNDHDIDRIIKMHISPINISVHTTNPELRVKMMKNPKAASSLSYIKKLADAGIKINAQLVLCPGINDGEELKRSLNDLSKLYPSVASIACVPVGITKYREGLFPIEPYNKETSRHTIDIIHEFSDKFFEEHGERLAYPSDEFLLNAELDLPGDEYYGEYNQLENGVGMLSLLREEFMSALKIEEYDDVQRDVSIATGVAAAPFIKGLVKSAQVKYNKLRCSVYTIKNEFFGERITVAGLLTAGDIINQLKDKHLGDKLILPGVMLKQDEDVFLDDVTLSELADKLSVKVEAIASNDGFELLGALMEDK